MRLERGSYDLVLTDYVMPGVNGLQLVETVRDSGARVGVIMLTGSPTDLGAEGPLESATLEASQGAR